MSSQADAVSKLTCIHFCILILIWAYLVSDKYADFVLNIFVPIIDFLIHSSYIQYDLLKPSLHILSCFLSGTSLKKNYTEGMPSSSLIRASADWGLDWMKGMRKKPGMFRCAGERAKMNGESGVESFLKECMLFRYFTVRRGGLFALWSMLHSFCFRKPDSGWDCV